MGVLVVHHDQMADALEHHLVHAGLQAVGLAGDDDLGPIRANVLDLGDEGVAAVGRHLVNVVPAGHHADQLVLVVRDHQTTDVEGREPDGGFVGGSVLVDLIVNLVVAAVVENVHGRLFRGKRADGRRRGHLGHPRGNQGSSAIQYAGKHDGK